MRTALGSAYRAHAMASVAAMAVVFYASPAMAQTRSFNVPAQSAELGIPMFAKQAGLQILADGDAVRNKRTNAVKGEMPVDEALRRLLAGTGLVVGPDDGTGILIIRAAAATQTQSEIQDAPSEDIVVTAQRRAERIQDVPLSISAFSQESLDAQKIDGGPDLLRAIPNVTFSKSNFSGYNFSIRGIGTKGVSATTDPGVAVAFNSSTLIVNRLFEQEFFDIERVEVLRGPQGTLYGRNATGGVINLISAKPKLGVFEAEVEIETGNYKSRRARGMINIPLGETFAIRAAGALTKRKGYGINEAANDPNVIQDVREDVDGRDLWSGRLTLGWEPTPTIRVNAIWERFQEDDNRVRTSKQLCHRDPGPETIGGVDLTNRGLLRGAQTSQGCLPGSLYADEAFGTPNGVSLPYVAGLFLAPAFGAIPFAAPPIGLAGLGGNPYQPSSFNPNPLTPRCLAEGQSSNYLPINVCNADPYGGRTQSRDLRSIHSAIEPSYKAKSNVFELSIDLDLSDNLALVSQSVYVTDKYAASQDYNRYSTSPIFNDSSVACDFRDALGFGFGFAVCDGTPYADGFYNVTPRAPGSPVGSPGVFVDPQLGASSSLVAQDLSETRSTQFNQEIRLASNFASNLNFSLGANLTKFNTNNDYYVFINAATLLTHFYPFNTHIPTVAGGCRGPTPANPTAPPSNECVYVDPNPLESINGEGHNYFRSANPYELTSTAIFGELYWQATDTLKVTLGGRMTWDRKVFTPIPSQLLLHDYRINVPEGAGPEACSDQEQCQLAGTGVNGRGSPPEPDIRQSWREPTGRLIVDWKPDLGFTDDTMIYASISRGYKAGGANPPPIAGPAGILSSLSSGGVASRTFAAEYVNAFEIGTKNALMGGDLILNGSAFYYDYSGYQVSKIVDRSANNENFDSTIAGAEFEWIWSPTRALRLNGTVGYLSTRIADGEQSIDLMDRTQGGHQPFTAADGTVYDEWVLLKPFLSSSSNCVAPAVLVATELNGGGDLTQLCPGGNVLGFTFPGYTPATDAPNGGAGFFADLGGNHLPNSPNWTVSLGGQYTQELPGGWIGTFRADHYWQGKSFARVYNTEYDRLRSWTNTNFSLWVEQPDLGVTVEVYVKNAFNKSPITDAFLNSDDSGLTTNVFTLDPRLWGVSVRKTF